MINENLAIEALENEQRTFKVINNSNCKNLCRAYAIWQDETRLYFAIENLPNRDLWHFVKENFKTKGPQDLHVCQYYGTEIAMGLSFLHSKSIVHRDIKLENIVLDVAGHAKIIDFGMVGFLKEKKCTSFVGSILHLAPEIVGQLSYGKSVDWFGLGAVLYEFCVGKPPFYKENLEEIYANIQMGPV